MTVTLWILFALGYSGSYSAKQLSVMERFVSQDECVRVQELLRAQKQGVWCIQATVYKGTP